MNNKGLASGIILIVFILFTIAFISLIVLKIWSGFNSGIQSMDESVVDNATKQDINDLTAKINWADKIFVFTFIALVIAYLISSATIQPQNIIWFLIFAALLIIVTILGMILSNMWSYLLTVDNLSSFVSTLPMTNWIMTFLPIISFFVGIIGAVIFFSRRGGSGGGEVIGDGY